MRICKTIIYICVSICAFSALSASAECKNSCRITEYCSECKPDMYSRKDGDRCARPACDAPRGEQCPPCIQTAEPTPEPTAETTAEPSPESTSEPTAAPTATPAATPTILPENTSGLLYSGTNSASAAEVVRQVNAERAKYGLCALSIDSELSQAAYIRAAEITQQFSHTRPDGSSWSTVSVKARGENIAMGYSSSDKVMAVWLTSEGHRANILRESFTTIGVCAYEYNGMTYWVQLFGTD